MEKRSLGNGPQKSVLVADERVFVAVTAYGPRRLLVSGGALAVMDEGELQASLAHELGHVERAHRPVVFLAGLLAVVARLIPGTRASEHRLRLSLERDADEYAVRSMGKPLDLASAICKMATGRSARGSIGALGLGGCARTDVRLDQLLGDVSARDSRRLEAGAVLVSAVLLVLALGVATFSVGSPAPGEWSLAVACSI